MKYFKTPMIIKDKGAKIGDFGFFAKQYEAQDVNVDPWLDFVLVSFYTYLKEPQRIIVEFQLVGLMNDKMKRSFRYPEKYVAQIVIPLNGMSCKDFFKRNYNNATFVEEYGECMQTVVDEYKNEIEKYRKMAKMQANN